MLSTLKVKHGQCAVQLDDYRLIVCMFSVPNKETTSSLTFKDPEAHCKCGSRTVEVSMSLSISGSPQTEEHESGSRVIQG